LGPVGVRLAQSLARVICVAVILVHASAALGQDAGPPTGGGEAPPNWAYQMAHDLMSPYCPGRTLSACPSPQAAELRQWILFQAAAGQTQEQIEAGLLERFGDKILSAPKAEGWGLSAYVVPALGFLIGGGLLWFLLQRLVSGQSDASASVSRAVAPRAVVAAGPALSDDEIERMVDEDLARL
jgi:cytochrome c-type biogenesis protein CcmH